MRTAWLLQCNYSYYYFGYYKLKKLGLIDALRSNMTVMYLTSRLYWPPLCLHPYTYLRSIIDVKEHLWHDQISGKRGLWLGEINRMHICWSENKSRAWSAKKIVDKKIEAFKSKLSSIYEAQSKVQAGLKENKTATKGFA